MGELNEASDSYHYERLDMDEAGRYWLNTNFGPEGASMKPMTVADAVRWLGEHSFQVEPLRSKALAVIQE